MNDFIEMSKRPIERHIRAYEELRLQWLRAKAQMEEVFEKYGLAGGAVLGSTDEEVRLAICGALAYVRFWHDFQNGYLEYGALESCDDGEPEHRRHVALKTLMFDKLGNVATHFSFGSAEDGAFAGIHLRTLAELMPKIVQIYYALPDEEE
jgi:hypothetical protein